MVRMPEQPLHGLGPLLPDEAVQFVDELPPRCIRAEHQAGHRDDDEEHGGKGEQGVVGEGGSHALRVVAGPGCKRGPEQRRPAPERHPVGVRYCGTVSRRLPINRHAGARLQGHCRSVTRVKAAPRSAHVLHACADVVTPLVPFPTGFPAMDFLDRRFGGPPDATVVSARPDPPALGDAHAAHFHAAHFYESDESLVRTVGEFLLAGIAAEAPLIMVATAEHLDQVSRYLEAAGVDVEAAHRADRLVRINAGELLDLFMVESLPDAGLFNAIVGGILDTAVQAGKGRAAPRAYGEMVDVLWRAGNPAGAIALEQLWERLLTEVPCHLLCAYSLEGFQGEADGASFDQVCRLHGQIVPAAGRDEAALVRKVQRLERQARLFEQELVRRRELEEALRHALARSRRAEEELTNLVEHSVEGLYWVGPGGAILWANQAQLDLLGYARDEY